MFEDNSGFGDESVVTAEDILGLLKDLKSNDKSPSGDVFHLLKNPNALRYFKYHIDQYSEIHAVIIKRIKTPEQYVAFLQSEGTFHKTVTEREGFYKEFLKSLLMPLVEVSAKFNKDDIFRETSTLIKECVFRKILKEFSVYLNAQYNKEDSSNESKACRVLFKFISNLYSSDVYRVGFKLIFKAFLEAYNNYILQYKFLVLLIEIIGFSVEGKFIKDKSKYQVVDGSLSRSLTVLNEILDLAAKQRIDFNISLNEVTFKAFITDILLSVIALTSTPDKECYQILLNIAEIYPLAIESAINEIIMYTMLADNSDCKPEYEQFMIKVLEIFNKLHRVQNLISKMIPVLQSGLANRQLKETVYKFTGNIDIQPRSEKEWNVDRILPKNVLTYFTDCILKVHSWQIINLLKTLLYHLNAAVEELPEMRGEFAKLINIEILSTLTCWILLSVRVASGTVEKYVNVLDDLQTTLGKFGVALLHKEHNHTIMRAFLNICYYWAEIYMVFEYYSVKDCVKMKKVLDHDLSPENLTYLHPYLSSKQWCLVFERITNFGETPCKEIMHKLIIQKCKAVLIFEDDDHEDALAPLVRMLASSFESSFVEIFTDKFMVNNVLGKMPSSVVTNIAEVILQDLYETGTELREHIQDSQLLIRGVLTVLFSKIHKLLRHKRKHGEGMVKVACLSKIVAILPSDMFLTSPNMEGECFKKATDLLVTEADGHKLDLKVCGSKIQRYLEVLQKLPLLFCTEYDQMLSTLLLLGLHRDLAESNCEVAVKKCCETLILAMVQHGRLHLLQFLNADLGMVVAKFDRSEELFSHLANNALRTDGGVVLLQKALEHMEDNVQYLGFAVIAINTLNRTKKYKISTESRELCASYKTTLCDRVSKILVEKSPEDHLIEPFAVVLKTCLSKGDSVDQLKSSVPTYLEFCLSHLHEGNLKGGLLLFLAVLHNRTVYPFDESLVLRVWGSLKGVSVSEEVSEQFMQLVMLTTSLIPNDQFANIFEDLLKTTAKSIDHDGGKEFFKHLRTWRGILSTNFNPAKTNILRQQVESLLEKLIPVLRCTEYKGDLFEEVIQFELSIIQATHVPLTAVILDYLLLTVGFLMTAHPSVPTYNMSMSLLEALLRHRSALIMDRLPPYLMQYKLLLSELCKLDLIATTGLQEVADCAHKLEKLTKNLTEFTKDMARISMYLIADILGQYELNMLRPVVKKHLDNCVYSLIGLCDQHAVQYLMRALSEASREMFKILYENYKKYHRFTGKV